VDSLQQLIFNKIILLALSSHFFFLCVCVCVCVWNCFNKKRKKEIPLLLQSLYMLNGFFKLNKLFIKNIPPSLSYFLGNLFIKNISTIDPKFIYIPSEFLKSNIFFYKNKSPFLSSHFFSFFFFWGSLL